MHYFMGIDLGGTKIKAVVIDEQGTVLMERKTSTHAHLGKEVVITRIVDLVLGVQKAFEYPVSAVGVTVPGVINMKQGTIELMPNFPGEWKGVALEKLLKDILKLPVYMLNDARAATYCEKKFGVARNYNHFVSLIIGTGVGGGIVHDGQLLLGSRGTAGELGHQVVVQNGLLCGCGNRGCLETVASGLAITTSAYRYIKQGIATSMCDMVQGDLNKITPEMVDQAASKGDEAALEIIKSVAAYICKAILNLKAILNPEAVILGGGVAQSDLLVQLIKQELEQHKVLLPDSVGEIDIIQSKFHDLSGAIGAAAWAINLTKKNSNEEKQMIIDVRNSKQR
ncbi:ROK family protein [Neobacillus drentensis]|uniref:ROK family protein n=1 Tax=Neobacillus drentensis TaxID=220684 RepID=UPI002FFE892A